MLPDSDEASYGRALEEFLAIAELRTLYRRLKPAVVHLVALKPILYGGASLSR